MSGGIVASFRSCFPKFYSSDIKRWHPHTISTDGLSQIIVFFLDHYHRDIAVGNIQILIKIYAIEARVHADRRR